MVKRAAPTDPVMRADWRVHKLVSPHSQVPAVRLLSKLSEVGDQPQLRSLVAAILAAGLWRSDRRLLRAGLRMLLAHELATLAKAFVKDRVDRTRPRSAQSAREVGIESGSSSAKEESSFPSGHSAGSLAVARAFAREYPEHAPAALGAAALVAAAQVPRCAHYVSDVGAGLLLGAVAEEAVDILFERAFPRDASGAPDQPPYSEDSL